MNAYIKYGEILSICSQDIEQKRNTNRIFILSPGSFPSVGNWGAGVGGGGVKKLIF